MACGDVADAWTKPYDSTAPTVPHDAGWLPSKVLPTLGIL